MMAFRNADKCDAISGCALDGLLEREFCRLEAKPVARIDQACGRFLIGNARHRVTARAA